MKKTALIVCHDAGGANLINSWKRNNNSKYKYYLYIAGPAKKIFKGKNIEFKKIKKININLIITGTSHYSTLEHRFRLYAKKNHIFSQTFIDHYTNYKSRFFFKNKYIIPDQIVTFDKYSQNLALKKFSEKLVIRKKNFYQLDIKKKIKNLFYKKKNKLKILYLSETFNSYSIKKEIYRKLNFFLKKIIKNNIKFTLRVRKHPAEKKFVFLKKINFINDANSSILSSLNWADVIIGCESYALILAAYCKKKVFTIFPINGRHCKLPLLKKIKKLDNFSFKYYKEKLNYKKK
jgi:hypothetical protein